MPTHSPLADLFGYIIAYLYLLSSLRSVISTLGSWEKNTKICF